MVGNIRLRGRTAAAVALAIALVSTTAGLAGASAPGGAASGEPVKIGNIEPFTGSAANPELEGALLAYIRDWNRRGGYEGRPVEVVSDPGGFEPTVNVAAAQRLINEDGVVAFLNIGNCKATLPIIKAAKIPILGPINDDCAIVGSPIPCVGKFGLDEGTKGMAFVGPDFPGLAQLKTPFVDYLEGKDIPFVDQALPIIPTGADIDGAVANLKAKGVDTLYVLASLSAAPLLLESANRQGFGPADGIRWVFGPNLYVPEVAALPEFDGAYVQALTEPVEGDSAAAKTALKFLEKRDIEPLTGFAFAGYSAGARIEQFFKHVKGAATSTAIAKARKTMGPQPDPLLPVKIDPAQNPDKLPSACLMLKAEDGAFVPASEFLVVPAKEFH